jgi:hypothetical protein
VKTIIFADVPDITKSYNLGGQAVRRSGGQAVIGYFFQSFLFKRSVAVRRSHSLNPPKNTDWKSWKNT